MKISILTIVFQTRNKVPNKKHIFQREALRNYSLFIYIWFYLTCLFIVLLLLNINSYGLFPTLEFSIESLGISDNHLFHIFPISVHSLQVYQPLLASVACNKTCHLQVQSHPNPGSIKTRAGRHSSLSPRNSGICNCPLFMYPGNTGPQEGFSHRSI